MTSGPVLITHAKADHWGDPIEDKDYKLELACHNPGDGEQLTLWEEADPAAGIRGRRGAVRAPRLGAG